MVEVETPVNPFIAPVNIETIEAFMNKVGYQGVVDKDYHSIKDDIPLVSVYTTGDVRIRGMLISDAYLTEEIHATDDFKEYETVFMNSSGEDDVAECGRIKLTTKILKITIRQQKVVERDHADDDSEDRIRKILYHYQPQLHLRLHTPNDEFPVSIFIFQVRYEECASVKGCIKLAEKATEDLIKSNLNPCIAATVIEDRDAFRSEVPYLVSQQLNAQAPKMIEEIFKNYVQSNVIQVYPTTTTSTKTTSLADLQQQLYFNIKRNLQDQVNDPTLWEVLKCKFEKSSISNTSLRDDDIHSQRHDDHQEDDAPLEGEKRVKRRKASKISKSVRGSLSKHAAKDFTTYVSK
nr:hypothetical protein [Tanacetum cinerariifolium]